MPQVINTYNTRDEIGDLETLDRLIDNSISDFVENDITDIKVSFESNVLTNIDMPNLVYTSKDLVLNQVEAISFPNLSSVNYFGATNATSINLPRLRFAASGSFSSFNQLTTLSLPSLEEISDGEFGSSSLLETIVLPQVKSIQDGNFGGLTNLRHIQMNKVQHIGNGNLGRSTSLLEVDFPELESLGSGNFGSSGLTTVLMPKLKTIGGGNFSGCPLTKVDFSQLVEVGQEFLKNYSELEEVNLDGLKTAGTYFLNGCAKLQSIQLDSLEECGAYSFNNTGLVNIKLNNVKIVGNQSFNNCANLEIVETGESTVQFGDQLFYDSPNMKSFVINSTEMSTLNGTLPSTFLNNSDGVIYVPTDLVDTYKADSSWGYYNIESIEQYNWIKLYKSLDSGTYKDDYKLGDEIPYTTTDGYTYHAQIVGFDQDVGTNNKTIAVTFINKETTDTNYQMNTTESNNGGWSSSAMRTSTMPAIKATLPQYITSRITTAKKYSYNSTTDANQTTNDDVWIPSMYELNGYSYENTGAKYNALFKYDSDLEKKSLSGGRDYYWTRTALEDDDENFYYIDRHGENDDDVAAASKSIAFGFCIGAIYTEETEWRMLSKSISDGTYKQKYAIGDLIPYTTTDGDTYHAQIVGFDQDVDANGNTIPVSFITQELWKTQYPMNATNTNSGGWEVSAMRTSTMPAIKAKLPEYVTSHIVAAKKYSYNKDTNADQITIDEVWIPNFKELGYTSNQESGGPVYSIYTNGVSRAKKFNGTVSAYWTRTVNFSSSQSFRCVSSTGGTSTESATGSSKVALGFCIGAN